MTLETLEALYGALREACAERFPGQKLVFGQGPECPRVVLVGEAPGAQEVAQGRPFSGQAGKNLDGFLAATGLEREELFITNTVKLRPCVVSPNGRTRNRPPNREELRFFIPWLQRELALLSPKLVVTLGNTPLRALTDEKASVGALHGSPVSGGDGMQLFCLYHPAAVIYDRSLRPVMEEDLGRLSALIAGL